MQPVIAVASGKGGTGKTTFAVNLAASLEGNVTYIDADVEEPNGHIFLKPDIINHTDVKVMIPKVDPNLCTSCGACSKVCKFNALILAKEKVILFSELCHGCGACLIACPSEAIKEGSRVVGEINTGSSHNIYFKEGRLLEGEAKSPPVIKTLTKNLSRDQAKIIDVSPGTSCPVIEGVRNSDFVVLVTEPTPFGLHDLILAVEMVKKINLPYGVVINKTGLGDGEVEEYCQEKEIPILMKIPFSKDIAYLCSRGELLVSKLPHYKKSFQDCFLQIKSFIATGMGEIKQ